MNTFVRTCNFLYSLLAAARPISIATFSMLGMLFLSIESLGQTNTFNNNSGNNWNTAANWSLGIVPTAAHDVVIPNNESVVVNTAAVCATLTINGGGDDSDVTISAGQSLTVSGNVFIDNGTGSGDNKVIAVGSGTLTCGSLTMDPTGDDNRNCSVTISTGTVTVTGNITMNDADPDRNFISFSGSGTLNIGGSISGGDIIPSTGTVNYNGTSAQTVAINANYVYNNLTINNSAGATLQAAVTATNVTGDLSVQSGIFNNGGFAITLSSGDDFSVSNGATFNLTGTSGMVTVSGGGTRTFGTTSTVNYSGTGQTVTALTYGNLGLSGSGTKTFNGVTTILGNLAINSNAVANLGTFTHTATNLLFNGVGQATGTWGHSNSPAANENNVFFANATGIVNIGEGSQTFTTSGTFTVPAGVTSITVQAWGGGGGGGAVNGTSSEKAAGGGKGGSFVRTQPFTVIPNQNYTVTVGAAGAAGTISSVNGGAGGTSSFSGNGVNIVAAGGNGGNGVNGTGAAGGQTGDNGTNTFTGVTQDVSASGGNGSGGSTGSDYSGGGGSGAGPVSPYNGNPASNQTGGDGDPVGGGDGGNGRSGVGGGSVGTGFGGSAPGGAGGGARTTNSDDHNGGAGAPGQIIISWEVCTDPDVPTISVTETSGTTNNDGTICNGASATLSISTGDLNDATDWQWYTGSCGGTSAGSGTSIVVSPTTTTTYYVRGEGGCVTPGACAQVTVTVNNLPPAPTCPSDLTVCTGSASFPLTGGSPSGGTYSGTGVSGGNFDPVAAGPGTHIITYTYTDGNGCSNFCTFNITVASPEMDVRGMGQSIADGDNTPDVADDTDFGALNVGGSETHTFMIVNSSMSLPLNLTGSPKVTLSGSSDFSVSLQPSSPVATSNGTTTFDIQFNPTSSGTHTATVSIANDDCDENPYTFDIQGFGAIPQAITVKGNSTAITNRALTTSLADHTDFGSANVSGGMVTRTFTIENILNGLDLVLNGVPKVTVADRDAADFTVTVQPGSPIAGGGSLTFDVTFDPSATGLRSAILIITHNDLPENPFVFTIHGTGL